MRRLVLTAVCLLAGCASYYDDYDRYGYHGSYASPSYHYSYTAYHNAPGSPLRLRPLGEHDFYMLDNYPGDYLAAGVWEGIGGLSHFAIHNVLQMLRFY